MHKRAGAALLLIAAYLFLHLPVEDFFDFLAGRYGFETYDRVAFATFLAAGAAILIGAWVYPVQHRRAVIGGAATVLLTVMALSQRFLLVVSIENIHYPQYALLVVLLVWVFANVEAAWLVATGVGILDEAYQFALQTRGTPDYFDWNDVVLNAIGAAAGAVLVLALEREPGGRDAVSRRAGLVIAILLAMIAFAIDPPVFAPFFRHTPGGRAFHKLSAAEASLIAVALWAGVRWMVASARSPFPNRPEK